MLIHEQQIEIHDYSIVFLSPFQERSWQLEAGQEDFTLLIFQEDFLNEFFADKLFTYKLLYFYQHNYPVTIQVTPQALEHYCSSLQEIKSELVQVQPDSAHIIRSLVYYLLQKLNRAYAQAYALPLEQAQDHYAFQYKKLLEQHIKQKQRVEDYTALLGISRITLNKAVKDQFHVTAVQLLKQRLLFEIKHYLLYTDLTVAAIADALNFSESNHLMRFFKSQTGQTTSEYLAAYQNGRNR